MIFISISYPQKFRRAFYATGTKPKVDCKALLSTRWVDTFVALPIDSIEQIDDWRLMAGRERQREKRAKQGENRDPSLFWSHRMWFDGIASCLGGREFILTKLDICAEWTLPDPHQIWNITCRVSRTCKKCGKWGNSRRTLWVAKRSIADHHRKIMHRHRKQPVSFNMRSSRLHRWGNGDGRSTVRPQDKKTTISTTVRFWRRECETDVIHQTFAKHYAELFNQAKYQNRMKWMKSRNRIQLSKLHSEPFELSIPGFSNIRWDHCESLLNVEHVLMSWTGSTSSCSWIGLGSLWSTWYRFPADSRSLAQTLEF